MPVEGTPRANDSARGVSARSVTSRRRTSHLDSPEQTAFTEVASEPWPTEASQPYICRHVDSEDSEIEWDDLPDVPGLVLANMGPSRYNVRMRIYGTEMDVCKTNAGIKAWRGWKTDPSEIALYESGYYLEIPPATANDDSGDRPDPDQPVLKLVGVYPVVDGYAQLNLQDVLGKAQTGEQALHVFPGSLLNKLGFGWPASRVVSEEGPAD